MIALIVAKAANNVIGNSNDLPWYLPADLKHFKELTTGHTVIMGRKTYESIYNRLHGPLPNRRNIVVTASMPVLPEGFERAASFDEALRMAGGKGTVFVIGGATIYKECLDRGCADTIYLTDIPQDIAGDIYFPVLDRQAWRETSREAHAKDEKNPYDYSFITLERRKA